MHDAPELRPRWYHLTPDRLILALLSVEGLLWLSEQFQWFPFNEHKGWTVLIAIASIGVFLLLMLGWFFAALIFRLRFQFSIRSLLVLTVAVALPFSWLAVEMKKAREQQAAVEWIQGLRGSVEYEYEFSSSGNYVVSKRSPGATWLCKPLGDYFFACVTQVWLDNSPSVTDAGLEHLTQLTHLRDLWLDRTQATDAGLVNLKGLTRLHQLDLRGTQVTDAGLEHLKVLTQLERLHLGCTSMAPESRTMACSGFSRHCRSAGLNIDKTNSAAAQR